MFANDLNDHLTVRVGYGLFRPCPCAALSGEPGKGVLVWRKWIKLFEQRRHRRTQDGFYFYQFISRLTRSPCVLRTYNRLLANTGLVQQEVIGCFLSTGALLLKTKARASSR